MIRECVICGRTFESRQRRKTCGFECHTENRHRLQNAAYARHALEQAVQKERCETAAGALAKVNAAARAAHVSYGHYVAIMKDAAARNLRPEDVEAKLRGAAQW